MKRLTDKIKKLPLISEMSHNGRVVIMTEPFWAIPFSLFSVFATLYMLELGLSERQIGLVQTVLVSTQIVASFFSGGLTDVLGRKRATLLFDFLSWGGACFVWAIAGSFSAFVIAAVLSGVNKIVFVSFNCLLTEGADNNQRIRNFSGLHFMVLAGGFFTPIGGIIVKRMGLIEGMRIMYLTGAVVMSLMFVVRHFFWRESPRKGMSYSTNPFRNMMDTLSYIRKNKQAGLAFGLQSVNQFMQVFKPLFYFAFLKNVLHLKPLLFSLVPVCISIITMIVLLEGMPRMKAENRSAYITLGLALSGISTLFFVSAFYGGPILIIFSIITEGIGSALIRPLIDSFWADCLDEEQRASQLGTGNFLIGLISIPAGILAAELYQLRPALPFIFVSAIFLLTAGVNVFVNKSLRKKDCLIVT